MKLDEEDRPVRPVKSRSYLFPSVILVVAVACGLAVAIIPELHDYVKRKAFAAAEAVGIKLPQDEYSAAYERMGIPPLPAELLASAKISSSLAKLSREPCDRSAIFAFAEALVAEREGRKAADAYLAFAGICPNSDGEQNRAAQILFQLGDSEKVITIADALIAKNPTIGGYRYLRGKALASVGRRAEALEDYKSTIELQKNPRDVGEWVFVEMANIYAAMGRPCDAAATIAEWAAIDPSTRTTPKARKMIEEYAAKGCMQNPAPGNGKLLSPIAVSRYKTRAIRLGI
jgi:tetratricopeptide (TPR) repeat protein